MKKLALLIVWFLIAGWAIFAIQSYANSVDKPPTEKEIMDLKSTNNQNRLTAQMRDKMLDLLKKLKDQKESSQINPFKKCAGRPYGEVNLAQTQNCGPWQVWNFLDDGAFPSDTNYSAMTKQSTNLGKKQFCGLNAIAFKNVDRRDEWAENICYLFKYEGNRYLYANEMHGRVYCEATCF